ncbi:hypothetical protein FTUN_6933 [Frigoriglobus tundricola]|uniref:Uncharacterized protein n=1 Tax=Frigoriglobus tundricola TaxID=2774151 RepID=A0A6M5YYW4_9BACT|nr:hypothetical protein FTUN_6933 [Frigoriglobus tundricola]
MKMWHEALAVIAECKVPAYWAMTSGARFWWELSPSELAPEAFPRLVRAGRMELRLAGVTAPAHRD